MKSAVKTMAAVADLELACDHPRMAVVARPADRCEVVTEYRRLEELSSDWQRLWQSDPRAEIFQTPEWARAWWRSFGEHYRLCTLVVFAGDEVVGIVPLVERDQRLQFLGTPEADYADILCEEHRAAEVLTLALQTLLDSVDGWNECGFEHLARHSRLMRYYKTLPHALRARWHRVLADRQYTIILRNQREEIFKSLLGKNHTKRLQNKLKKAGQLRFRHLDPATEAEAHLAGFFRHHVRRHAAIGRRSACASPEFCRFIREIIRELGATDRVRFGVLELDGRPLAWELAFQVNGKFLLYQHTFDLDVSHYTPGEVLLWNALDYARENVSREFDFGSGDELYKDRFANYSRETYSLFLAPRGLRGGFKGWLRSSRRGLQSLVQPGLAKLKEVAKSRRMTLRAFRAARMWMLGTMGCLREARKNGTVLSFGFDLAKNTFGSAVWSRKAAEVFVQDAAGGRASLPSSSGDNLDVDVHEAQFGELVDLSWAHPGILSLNALQDCRKRMKDGDRVYVVREKSQVAGVYWASAKPDGPAMVVEAAWSARDRKSSTASRRLLSVISKEAASRKLELQVHCSTHQPQLRRELEAQGFVARFRTVHYRIFGRIQRESITTYPKTAGQASHLA